MLALSGRCLPRHEHAQPPAPDSGSSGDSSLYPGKTCVREGSQANGVVRISIVGDAQSEILHIAFDTPICNRARYDKNSQCFRRRTQSLRGSKIPTAYLHQTINGRYMGITAKLAQITSFTVGWVFGGLHTVKKVRSIV